MVNLFLQSPAISFVTSVISVLVFTGLTAYDVQKIKALESAGLPEDNLAIYGALELYLDFINIFLQILELFNYSENDINTYFDLLVLILKNYNIWLLDYKEYNSNIKNRYPLQT